jgi:hypothetical protein
MQPGVEQPVQQPNQPVPPQVAMPQAPALAPPAEQTPAQKASESKKNNPSSTQNTLLFSEMRENMMIMHDASFRAVVECESINFDLMSSREREAVEYSYQNFLNSLYFPVQILIRSRRVDIGPYIDRLVTIRRSQDNMMLSRLMDDYIDFIDILSQEANIMDKSFYIVIPYYPIGDVAEIKKQAKGLFDSFFGGTKEPQVTKINQPDYEKAKDEVRNRVDSVVSGLFQLGVKSQQLTTQQLSVLFYNSYNPDISARQPMTNASMSDFATTYVRKGEGDANTGGVL